MIWNLDLESMAYWAAQTFHADLAAYPNQERYPNAFARTDWPRGYACPYGGFNDHRSAVWPGSLSVVEEYLQREQAERDMAYAAEYFGGAS